MLSKLNTGVKRLLIVLITIPVVAVLIFLFLYMSIFAFSGLFNSGYGEIVFLFIWLIIFAVVAAIVRWVYLGFKKGAKE